jgi:hypothetical protein
VCFNLYQSDSPTQILEADEALGDFSLSEVPDDFFDNVLSYNNESHASPNLVTKRQPTNSFSQEQQQMNLDFSEVSNIEERNQLSTIDQNLLFDRSHSEGQKIFREKKAGVKNRPVKATKSSPAAISTRTRNTITAEQRAILARSFSIYPFPDRMARNELSKATGMGPRQVQIWFQNMRSKLKKKEKASKV